MPYAPSTSPPSSFCAGSVREGFLEKDGRRFFYRQEGLGPDLVLLHGFTSNHAMWAFQRAALGAHYRILTMDLPGHGRSDELPYPHGPEQAAALVHGLMDRLEVQQAHVGGLSMGGAVAQAFAGQYPDRLRSLLLFDTGGRRTHPLLREVLRLLHMSGHALKQDHFTPAVNFYRSRRRDSRFHEAAGITPTQARETVHAFTTHQDLLAVVRACLMLVGKPDQLEVVRQLEVPLLIVCGTADWFFTESLHLFDAQPQSSFAALEDATHGTAVAHPLAFNHALLTFLSAVEQGVRPSGLWFYPAAGPHAPPRPSTREALEIFRRQSLPSLPFWQAWRDVEEGLEKIFPRI